MDEPVWAPLSDMSVVDISQQLPGPYASGLLRSLGARVVKVEAPGGDPSRAIDPAMFALINEGKDVTSLDLKHQPDVEALHELVRDADVFIEGFRPGVAARLGADWPTLRSVNPSLVYCSISAAGQDGPFCRAPMHDLNLQAMAGLDPGHGIGVPWVDLGTGTLAALAIASAWHQARATGAGCWLDGAMLDTAVLWARVKASAQGRTEPCYGVFPTSDQRQVAVAVLEDHLWLRLCEALSWDDWARDPTLHSYAGRVARGAEIHARLKATLGSTTSGVLADLAGRFDLPLTPAGHVTGDDVDAQLGLRHLHQGDDRRMPLPPASTDAARTEAGS